MHPGNPGNAPHQYYREVPTSQRRAALPVFDRLQATQHKPAQASFTTRVSVIFMRLEKPVPEGGEQGSIRGPASSRCGKDWLTREATLGLAIRQLLIETPPSVQPAQRDLPWVPGSEAEGHLEGLQDTTQFRGPGVPSVLSPGQGHLSSLARWGWH